MSKVVLIVDDCLNTTAMTSFFLKKLGIEKILVAHNQEDFMKCWVDCKPDLIITDWNIEKDFNGEKVIAEASSHQIPVALVTSEEKDSIISHISNIYCEAFAFLQKPLNLSHLKLWLESLN